MNHVDAERSSFDPIKQRSDSLTEICTTPISKIYRSSPFDDLSTMTRPKDMEIIRSELRVIISQLSLLTQHQHQQAENDDVSQDWKFVAMVVDRLCLIIFTLSMIIFSVLTVVWTPNIFKLR